MSVYFIRPVGMLGPIKIGCSFSPDTRRATLDTWSPFALAIVAEIEGGMDLERRFHARFKGQHERREWFSWSHDLQETIDAISAGVFDIAGLPDPENLANKAGGNRRPRTHAERLAFSYRIRFVNTEKRLSRRYHCRPNPAEIAGSISDGTATPELFALADDMLAQPEKYSETLEQNRIRCAEWRLQYADRQRRIAQFERDLIAEREAAA